MRGRRYFGPLEGEVARAKRQCLIELEIPKRSDNRFKTPLNRWIVEQTFGWLIPARRLTRDHGAKIDQAER